MSYCLEKLSIDKIMRDATNLSSLHRTSYDAVKKQHWLSVYRQRLVGRFLMKDNLKGRSIDAVNEEVQSIVDHMIRTLSEMETKAK